MRTNIQGWNSLELDGKPIDADLELAAWAVLDKHLGPARVRGVAEIGLFWTSSGKKRAGPSRVLDVRYVPAKRKAMCRLMLAPTAATVGARNRQYLGDMARLIVEVLVEIEAHLAKRGIIVGPPRLGPAIARDLAKLAPRPRRSRS